MCNTIETCTKNNNKINSIYNYNIRSFRNTIRSRKSKKKSLPCGVYQNCFNGDVRFTIRYGFDV